MMEWIKNHRNMVLAALGVLMVLLPVVVHSSYLLGILIRILLYTMLAGSLNMINGYSGQMNLGHAGLYCIGSYTAGILAVKYQVGFLPLLFISGFVTALFGFLVSLPTIKLAGVYLAIVTIGFSEITRLVALNWTGLTGGPMGIKGIPRPEIFGLRLSEPVHFYYLALVLAVLVLFMMRRVVSSRIGRAWIAIREDQVAASFLGVNTRRFKSLNFSFGAFIAGVAGCFAAYYYQFISSDMFSMDEGFNILAMVIIGGQGTLIGPVAGSLVVNTITEVFRFAADYRMVMYAVLIIVMMWFRPQGLVGASNSVFAVKRTKNSGKKAERSGK
ncbi:MULTISPECIES: branched-chain amino acid ABC transporter permease [Enterocloster]|uniref:Amino acid/amide ABC transporter membrane protein 2, HAAT family n=1 Tax=Enterocloster lavalensis TaxID=460384 RepID=A0A1I0CXV1_9FIRM|nr:MULTISPECIES: branched-chain amino acid ABC transporter permease [Enterocloster]MCB6342396.1 branched-chain amino acid ABC transporter permease [Enterocloster lavalensis]MDR3757123.1 branched-chain amino acid ABC transporter permease [Enterocloster sp.]PST32797.1 branched-chain amino acid ABC transporter permease [Enterocloster lavalensis]SET23962.1 amino acid/amide ABC transporter membrane protein 2, HAAT family [Enterocloster lavalensis]